MTTSASPAEPALDVYLEMKAVKLLDSVVKHEQKSVDAFLSSFAPILDESSRACTQSIVILISSSSQIITAAATKMLGNLVFHCSDTIRLALIKTDLIPQLIITLNPQSLSFAEAVDIHVSLLKIIDYSLWLSTPDALSKPEKSDDNEQQDVHKTLRVFLDGCRPLLQPSSHPPSTFWISLARQLTLPQTILTARKVLSPDPWAFSIPTQTPSTPSHSPLPLPSPHSFLRTSMTVVRSTRNTHIDRLPPLLSLSRRRDLHSSLLPSFNHNAITQQSPPS
ncbi:hypothetical protein BLNAU_11743 [Blattamonas nauphoetae]|uniref:Uncharacterized protein n=1 Tax=Blattamonas nauphoetae TaxID=2049346 RepID=A0ABQ9XQ08_9EUKA|nr:hypothetical protein BLNAU_11743 [Blattamonas nauphoetae]